jgi:hypothetical protein
MKKQPRSWHLFCGLREDFQRPKALYLLLLMQNKNTHTDSYSQLIGKLDAFIRKYYKNQVYKGLILTLAILLFSFILVNVLEYFGHFGILMRGILFYTYLVLNVLIISYYVLIPLLKLYRIGKIISYAQASEIIGKHFAEVKDKLLNTLQLQQQKAIGGSDSLLEASILQKTEELRPIPFQHAVNMLENRKYLKYALIPLILLISIFIGVPKVFTESSERIVKHNQHFEKPMPFSFELKNRDMNAVKGEDFLVELKIHGESLPERVYIELNGNEYAMQTSKADEFTYRVKKM